MQREQALLFCWFIANFQNTLSFPVALLCSMTVTTPLTVFIKKKQHWFSQKWSIKFTKNAWNQRKVQSCKENRYYSVDLEPIFQKYLVICNDCNYALNSVYLKNIDFLKKDQLNSHKNAWNQSKVPRCNENKFLFYQYTSSFSEILFICNDCNYAFNSVYEKTLLF